MNFNGEVFGSGRDRSSQTGKQPLTGPTEGNDELTEGDLQREGFRAARTKPVKEGQPMGGHNFGKNNITSAANDKNNPSRYAGSNNPFFKSTEPMEEHPENNNFKVPDQQGRPDYDKARPDAFKNTSEPKPEKVERGNDENDLPHKGADQSRQETDEKDQPNIPGPNELPDQQKVGEDLDEDEREHIET